MEIFGVMVINFLCMVKIVLDGEVFLICGWIKDVKVVMVNLCMDLKFV